MSDLNDIHFFDFERIEQFILNKLSASDRDLFLQEMNRNVSLRDEVERQKLLMLTVEAGGLREEMKAIATRIDKERVVSFKIWYSAAAIIVVVLGVSWWFLRNDRASDDLFAQMAKPDPGLAVPMSSSTDYSFYDAMVDYKAEKYDLAIQKWQPQLLADLDNDSIMYFLGSSYFNLKKWNEARDYYLLVRKNPESAFYAKSGFYLALIAYREQNSITLAELAKDTLSPYADKISSLKEAMDKP